MLKTLQFESQDLNIGFVANKQYLETLQKS